MKILFVTDNLSNSCGANVNIVMTLVKQLRKSNEVYLLTRYGKERLLDNQKTVEFSKVFAFKGDEWGDVNAFSCRHRWTDASIIKKILLLLTHPQITFYMVDTKYNNSTHAKRKYRKELEKLCLKQDFDVVIGVGAPYYIIKAVAESKINCVKSGFQLDPYTYNYTLPKGKIKQRSKHEAQVLKKIDILFAVTFVAEEIRNKKITFNIDQIVPFELPCIRTEEIITCKYTQEKNESPPINFVFSGQFYDVIRNPEYLLKLFTKLPQNYILHLVGGGAGSLVEVYKKELGERLICHGWVSSTEAEQKVREADILINLNNTVSNQLSSKLFDYISTGKPIINICKIDNCLSLKYTQRYENCIDVFETQNIDKDLIFRIEKFILQHKGTVINSSKIIETYYENTDVYVADLLTRNLLEKVMRRKSKTDER